MLVQYQKEVGTFVLDSLIEFVGFKALEFIISFGLFFAIIYLGLTLTPFFKEEARPASAVIAIMAALATSYYTFINEISIIDLIGPFSFILVAVLIAIVIINSISAIRGAKAPNILTTVGVVLLAVGFALSEINHKNAFMISAIGAIILLIAFLKALFGK